MPAPGTATFPTVFIGSSTEALDVARALEELLSKDAIIDLWPNMFGLSRPPANGRWMRLPFVIEAGDSVRDGVGESVGVSEGAGGELMLLEVAPASFDVVQFGGVFRQPFEGEPRARGERLCCQLAAVDWSVIENRDQGASAFGGAVGGAKLIEQGNKVGGALGGAGMDEQVPVHRIKAPSIARFFA